MEDHPHFKNIIKFKKLSIVSILLIVALAVGLIFSYISIKNTIIGLSLDQKKSTQFLIANVNYHTERQRLILFSRDEIMRQNKKVSYDEAFQIASTNLKYCEIYPSVDPLFLLALQWRESRFTKNIMSHMGAIGLCQVMPITAKNLTKMMGINYNDSMLYDIDYNIRLGVQCLDDAIFIYKSHEAALAYYNGGWIGAYGYTNKNTIPSETKEYIPIVISRWKKYTEDYKIYRMNVNGLMVDTLLNDTSKS